VAKRRTVHQWHTSSLKLNGRYHTLRKFYLYQFWHDARTARKYRGILSLADCAQFANFG